MDVENKEIRYAISNTEVLRFPKQSIATFGSTNIKYFLLTKPAYSELTTIEKEETVIREGRIKSERPRIVTPSYISRLEGFGENAERYIADLIRAFGPDAPGIFYSYINEHGTLEIVSDRLEIVAGRLNERMDREGENLTAIIKGVDELWDVSLFKVISDLTINSIELNINEMGERGLLGTDPMGMPISARWEIEKLFEEVRRGEVEPSELKKELDRWNLFPRYEDKFLNLFRRK